MTGANDVDLTVIGGGPGGYVAALRAAQAGLAVVLVEQDELGGVCLNAGCVPSKALIHGAELMAGAGAAADIWATPPATPDVAALVGWQRGIVDRLRSGVAHLLDAAGVTVLRGTGRFDGSGRVMVEGTDERVVTTGQAIVATGSAALELSGLPFDGERCVSSTEALTPRVEAGELVVVGGGYIGLELASAYRDLGWAVTIVEATPRVLPSLDADLARLAHRDLTSRDVDVLVDHVVRDDDGSVITVEGPDGRRQVPADLVVVAVGRRPRTEAVGLESIGVATEPAGFIPVDEGRRTTAAGVFAIGDVTAGPALAHKAMQEGTVAAEVAAGQPSSFRPSAIPAVVYTRPELATVGLSLAEAEERGIQARAVKVPLGSNARAMTLGGGRGFARLVVDGERDLLLGAQLAGPGVGELIGTLALALEMGAVLQDLAGTILPHPSLSELIAEAAHAGLGAPRHQPTR